MYQPTINYADARLMVERGAQLVDVRQPKEHRRSALPGSVNIPLPDAISRALKQLDKHTPVLLYSNSGQRSGEAKRLLEACGFSLVHNLGRGPSPAGKSRT